MVRKVYVRVNADFYPDGEVRPCTITWADGRKYEITRIVQRIRAASTKAGGCGIRYTVHINGQERYLFRDEDRWFVEGKTSSNL